MGVVYTKIYTPTIAAGKTHTVAGIIAAGNTCAVAAEFSRLTSNRAAAAVVTIYIQIGAIRSAAGFTWIAFRTCPAAAAMS